MNIKLKESLKQYIGETLGIHPLFSEWGDAGQIPYAIRGDYDFALVNLLDRRFVVLSPKDEAEVSPAKVAKHLDWIEQNFQFTGIFIANGLEAYNRKRLIEQKVSFIIPGNQLYLPELGIDFREHLRKVRQKHSKLSPSTQLVLLAYLLGKFQNEAWTATSLAGRLELTKMTISRAIEELESQDLIEVRTEGREKQIHFKMRGRELWEKAKPALRSPVQNRVFVENMDWGIGAFAGLSALSENTMLVAPTREVRAISSREWKALQTDTNLRIIPQASADLAQVELEIWKYDPRLLNGSGKVDALSLYLSLTDATDERVEAAREQLLEAMQW